MIFAYAGVAAALFALVSGVAWLVGRHQPPVETPLYAARCFGVYNHTLSPEQMRLVSEELMRDCDDGEAKP